MSGGSKKTGERPKTILEWCTKGAEPDPFNPRVRYLFEKINAVVAREDISGEEKTKLLEDVKALAQSPDLDKLVRAEEEAMYEQDEDEYEYEEDDGTDEIKSMKLLWEETNEEREDMEEDGEMGKTLQLGDQEKPGIVKRPQSSPVESELESKKPRVADGLGCQGGNPDAAEM